MDEKPKEIKRIEVLTIDTGVPIPSNRISYPLDKLDVGDSFVFPIDKRGSVQSMVSKYKRQSGRDFIVKKMDADTGRVWRIS